MPNSDAYGAQNGMKIRRIIGQRSLLALGQWLPDEGIRARAPAPSPSRTSSNSSQHSLLPLLGLINALLLLLAETTTTTTLRTYSSLAQFTWKFHPHTLMPN
jgi:hypothetical protein